MVCNAVSPEKTRDNPVSEDGRGWGSPAGVLWVKSDGEVERIFWGFEIHDFGIFLVENFG